MDEKIYKIGDYEFETLREYRQAQEDLKKIKYITDELDIYDPEVAIRLYTMMRTKKIRFKSEIGKSFFWCISDIVADSSQNMIEEKIAKEEAEAEAKLPFHFTWQKVVGIVCIIVATACIGYYAISEYADYKAANRLKDLQNKKQNNVVEHLVTGTEQMNPEITEDATETGETTEQPLIMLEDYVSLYAENPELIGWLHIPDTDIDYPVMQSSQEEPDYYLKHDFDKNDDLNGTLFIDVRNDYINRDTNIFIYGHNMKSGMMFGELKKYLDEDFYNAHKTIEFNTLYERGVYEIIEVGLSEVQYQDENVFRYYNFLNADSEEEYQEYLKVYQNPEEKQITNTEKGLARKMSALRSFYGYYFKHQIIEKNPTLFVDMPKLHEKAIVRLDTDEVASLLDFVEHGGDELTGQKKVYYEKTKNRDLAIITLLLGTGIRVSECVGLDIQDVDFKNNGITVVRKGGNEMVIYFGEEVEHALKQYLYTTREAATPLPGHENALFLSTQRRRMGVQAVENMVKKYARQVTPNKKITPHKLRSTYGTTLYKETGDIYLVADVLGHKDVNTTKKHYAAIDEDRRRMAAKAVTLREP